MRSPLKLALSATFAFVAAAVTAQADQIVISEIMYHPTGTKPEFIAIKNISYNPRDTAFWKLTAGVNYTMPDFNAGAAQDVFIKPLEKIIFSSADPATTRAAYNIPGTTRVFGPWTGSLSDSGERVTLEDKNGVTLSSVKYGTSGLWPRTADGTGHSLQIINTNCDPDDWHNWKASSAVLGGSTTNTVVINYADTWQWNIPTSDMGAGWRTATSGWASGASGTGPGLLGYESAQMPGPGMQLPALASGNVTYLFRKTFTYSGTTSGASIIIDQIVDDGVIYYLNGNQLGLTRMDNGTAWNANALPQVTDAVEEAAAFNVAATGLVVGTNVFCAEVHNGGPSSSDLVFGAKATISVGGGAASNTTLRLSEAHFGVNGHMDWVELQNPTGTAQSAAGLFIASKADLSDKVALSGTVAINGFSSWTVDFTPDNSGEVVLYFADSANNILGTAGITHLAGRDSVQAVWPVLPAAKPTWELLRTKAEWYSATTATQNAANNPPINTSIVINEIMCDPMSEQAQAEYIELFNKTGAPIVLTGWKIRGGLDFDFPAGTTIAANGYLVVGANKAYLQTIYGGATIVGDWSGKLSNKADLIQLKDQYDNLADEVDYHTGGDWPDLSTYKGSSMELINPNMDNNRASAWRASDESNKSTFASYTCTGTYLDRFDGPPDGFPADRPTWTTDPASYKEWFFFAVKDAHLIIRNMSLIPSGGGSNLLQNPGQMTGNGNSNNGWLAQGTHGQSYFDAAGLHLISDGHGDPAAGKAEIDCTGINAGSSYTMTFEARWVSGTPVMMGHIQDHSMGGLFRISVPDNLGTPGAQNSKYNGTTPPQVDSVIHSPAVPTSSQSVKITARVYSQAGIGSVEARVRQDDINTGYNDNNFQSTTMVDNGTNGDAVSGDGVYTATITNHQVDGRLVQFYVRATASNGQQAVDPPKAGAQPAMWIVDNLTRTDNFPAGHINASGQGNNYPRSVMGVNNIRRQRFIMSEYDVDALRSDTSPGYGAPKSKYNYRYPRMSNHYFPLTFINNETDVYYLCEARQSGSRWHRSQDMATFDRLKWKLPDDRLFRKHSKLYTDLDCTKISGLDNHVPLYISYLVGYKAVNEIELAQTAINNSPVAIRSESELTDNDLIARAFKDGSEGQLVKCSEQLMYNDNYGDTFYPPKDFSYSYRGTDNPVRWHGTFPLRNREWEYDYSSLIDLFKTWSNSSSTREQLDRIVDCDEFFMMAAVRGYTGDWDSLTSNGKNGYLYRRPTDNKWLNLHWDGDSACELNSSGNFVFNAFPGLGEFASKPWNRRIFNYYLTEILAKWSTTSPRLTAWFTAQQNAVTGAYAYGVPTQYSFPTPFPAQYTTFHSQHQPFVLAEINSNIGTGGAGNAYTASFATTSPGSGQTGGLATVDISGTAPSSAYSVVVVGHPEAVLTWTNQVNWTLAGVVLKNGANNLTIQMLDRLGVQVGSNISWSYNKNTNAAPVMDLNVNPGSYNVTLGQLLTLDAGASYDPDGGALTFGWSNTPAGGVTVTAPTATPANSLRNAIFTVPGVYSFTATGTDPSSGATGITREVSVASSDDFEPFNSLSLDLAKWTIVNTQVKNSGFPSRFYSLSDKPGSLVMQVLDSSAKSLSYTNNQPTIMRNMPASVDCAILTDLTLDTRRSGSFFTGLYLETVESGATIRYAFGLDDGTHITAKRMTSGGISNVGTANSTEGDAKLRIRRVGTNLQFQRRMNGVWSTLFTQGIGAGTLVKGGVFLATSAAENARVAFDYVMVVDPSNTASGLIGNLKITEVMYHPLAPDAVEYIELKNVGVGAINLSGAHFEDGNPVTGFTFGSVPLNPGEFAVVTNNTSAFTTKYGSVPRLLQWPGGSLNNGGEKITLLDVDGNIIHNFTYGTAAPWPAAADGTGPSMDVINLNGDYGDGANWTAGTPSPGAAGTGPDTDDDGVSDAVETAFGTDPNSAASRLVVTPTRNGSSQAVLGCSAVNGHQYRVEYCDNLGAGWLTLGTLTASGSSMSYTDTTAPVPAKRFYRIVAL